MEVWFHAMSDVLDLLHSPLRSTVETLRERFVAARPFRHVVIDNFLATSFCERLITEFPLFDERNALNEMGEAGGKAVVPAVRRISPAYSEFDRLMRAQEFRDWLAEVTAIRRLLYDAEYAGGGTHENLDGQELDWHVDFNYHPTRPFHRRLNLIVFLNPQWNKEWGGCLEFHRDPWHCDEIPPSPAILPLANTCVIFETTENSWHGFERIRLPEDGASGLAARLQSTSIPKRVRRLRPHRPMAPSTPHAACRRNLHPDIHYVQSTWRTSRSCSRGATARFDTYTAASLIFLERSRGSIAPPPSGWVAL
jgi:hypothetical protein